MSDKIVRTPKRATGGITPQEKIMLADHANLWIARAMRTDPIEPDKITPAIEGIYAAAGLKKPRVVIVPSPIVMAAAYGAAAAVWHGRGSTDIATRSATDSATDSATYNATDIATRRATYSATDSATYSATDSATRRATNSATYSATDSATDSATRHATRIATISATDIATISATESATRRATNSATRSATRRATNSATRRATRRATYSATDSATISATDSATRRATYSATDSATISATDSATASATNSATRSATNSATRIATISATRHATNSATNSATDSATRSATYSATDSATASATNSATRSATNSATISATNSAFLACEEIAGAFGLMCAKRWVEVYQGGNMWAGYDCYLTAMRDIIGLRLPSHDAYHYWEQAAIHGGFRVMHPEFCMVCDFPVYIKMDESNEPHCEDGPSHLWRDGVAFYFWHGTQVPAHWIESRDTVDPVEILSTENVEQRAAGISILGMDRMLDRLDHRIIDSDPDPMHGDLIEVTIPDLDPVLYLRAHCPRNGTIMEAVNPAEMDERTVRGAQAWRLGIPASEFVYPTVRT